MGLGISPPSVTFGFRFGLLHFVILGWGGGGGGGGVRAKCELSRHRIIAHLCQFWGEYDKHPCLMKTYLAQSGHELRPVEGRICMTFYSSTVDGGNLAPHKGP